MHSQSVSQLPDRPGLRLPCPETGVVAAAPPRAIRCTRERILQTLWFEGIGLALVSPIFARLSGEHAGESAVMLTVLSIAMMSWSALYNSAFDMFELLFTGRVASARPHGMRIVHAFGNEATALFVTWPLIVVLTRLSWREALVAELGLTSTYALYGYMFHLAFDRLRPVVVHSPSEG